MYNVDQNTGEHWAVSEMMSDNISRLSTNQGTVISTMSTDEVVDSAGHTGG